MIEHFDLKDVNQSAAAINPEKLQWLNQQYIKGTDPLALAAELRWHLSRLGIEADDEPKLAAVVRAQAERAKTLKEMAENSRFFFKDFSDYESGAVQKTLRRKPCRRSRPCASASRHSRFGRPALSTRCWTRSRRLWA